MHLCGTYTHMLYTHSNESLHKGTHTKRIAHIASQETPLFLTPLFFPPMSTSPSLCLSTHPSLHPHQLHSRDDIISYLAPPTLPQGGETTREREREKGGSSRVLGWVGLTIDRKRKRDTENNRGT